MFNGIPHRVYKLEDLFDIRPSKNSKLTENLARSQKGKGTTPVITATSKNNGVSYYIDNLDNEFVVSDGGFISYGALGDCFYQPRPCIIGNGAFELVAFDKLTVYQSLYIVTVINAQKSRFSYGRQVTLERARQLEIQLPSQGDKPLLGLMGQYMEDLANQRKSAVHSFLLEQKRMLGRIPATRAESLTVSNLTDQERTEQLVPSISKAELKRQLLQEQEERLREIPDVSVWDNF